jgi:ubiquinone/menaquinone biosynthesis C-methylase UbiE
MELELLSLTVLKEIGLKQGQHVLDFGCGYGTYTIPVAEIVGEQGRVHALDMDKEALYALMQRAQSAGLNNIDRMDTAGGLEIALADESVDAVLLFDVFHSFYFPKIEDRRRLLDEIRRVMQANAFLSISVWPDMTEQEAIETIKDRDFYLEGEISGIPLDNNLVEMCKFLNFRKNITAIYADSLILRGHYE